MPSITTLTTLTALASLASTNPLPNWSQWTKAFDRLKWAPPSNVAPDFVPPNPTPAPYVSGPKLGTTNFPDPCIIAVNGTYYAFATGSGGTNIPIAQSADFVNWELVTNDDGSEVDALPTPGAWVNMTAPNTWAPDVDQLDDGTFIMYYSATALASPGGLHHCVSAASSNSILGPYIPLNDTLVCPLSQGGAIDPAGFKDWTIKGYGWGRSPSTWSGSGSSPSTSNPWLSMNASSSDPNSPIAAASSASWSSGGFTGQRYLLYKVDGNSLGHGGTCGNDVPPFVGTPIQIVPVASDGVTITGAPVTLLNNDGYSDTGVVEAPSLVKSEMGEYVLFFSRDCYSSPNYTVSWATAENVEGPYTRRGDLLHGGDDGTGTDGLSGPGGATVLWDGVHMVFHANALESGFNNDRLLHTAIIDIEGTNVIA